jgi:hypothetical protein
MVKLSSAQWRALEAVERGEVSYSFLTRWWWNHATKRYMRSDTMDSLWRRRLIGRADTPPDILRPAGREALAARRDA